LNIKRKIKKKFLFEVNIFRGNKGGGLGWRGSDSYAFFLFHRGSQRDVVYLG
jgi:hypothetical protein